MQMMAEAVGTQDVVTAANIAALAQAEARLADYTARHDAEEAAFALAKSEARHEHQWDWSGRKVGRCLYEYSCTGCGAVQVVDSSD